MSLRNLWIELIYVFKMVFNFSYFKSETSGRKLVKLRVRIKNEWFKKSYGKLC